MSAAEGALAAALDARGIKYERGYRFCDARKWEADFMFVGGWDQPNVLVEVEGRGRHQTYVGFRNDCVKYNAAARLGYIVLRFPAGDYKPSKSRKHGKGKASPPLWPRGVEDWVDEIERML